jgi:glycosyltransferase involved in cell wall biosynthesis
VTERRVRVLYLAHAFNIGGAEEMVLNLVRRLPARFEPQVCCIHAAGPIGEEIRKTGTPVAVLGLNPGLRRPFDVNGIRRYLRDARPDIVHTFLLTASLYGRLAAILERVPIVIGTEVNIYAHKRPHHALVERLLMRGTDRVVVSAESVRDFYIRQVHADPAKVDVIYNAVDFSQARPAAGRDRTRAALGLPGGTAVAGVIARLTEQKGHRFLFEAVAATPQLSDLHLLIVGDGELRPALVQDARDRGIAGRVHFLGARRDLGDLLAAMDLFVLPSLWEGLPLSMVLAMGAGIPVVATSVAGIPEVVRHGETGWLVPPANAAALGDAIARLLTSPDRGAALAAAARASVVSRFNVEGYVASVAALYDQLLAERQRPGVASSSASQNYLNRRRGRPFRPSHEAGPESPALRT